MSAASAWLRRLDWRGRQAARARAPRGGILMYHRVAEERHDPWRLCVSPARFEEQMALLARARAAVDLAAFAEGATYDRDTARFAVTFDDGYADDQAVALPILERHGIPATIFLVGHAPGRRREFWWDALQRAILESGALPATLDFPFGRGQRHWDTAGLQTPDAPGWSPDLEDPRTPRQRLFIALWEAIVVLAADEQDAAVDHLLGWAGMPLAAPPERLPAPPEAFAALAGHPLVTIGSHTLDHLSLPDLSDAGQHRQIVEGHHEVERLMGKKIDRFSYPFGRHDARARALVAGLGVRIACTSAPMPAVRGDDPRVLPRLQATEQDGEGFARWLRDDHQLRLAA